MRGLAIFDLDDTLVDTSDVYWKSRSAFLDVMERSGFERAAALEDFEWIDGQNIARHGYVPERYGLSMAETYAHLCRKRRAKANPSMAEAIRRAGKIVLTESPRLLPGAIELLDGVRSDGMTVALVTRGVDEVQRRKVVAHQLGGHFDRIEVVAVDKSALFSELIYEAGVPPSKCWVVGDSIRSDINPGIDAGANCILYLYTHHSYHWRQEYGEQSRGAFYLARSLLEVLQVIREPQLMTQVTKVPPRNPHLPS